MKPADLLEETVHAVGANKARSSLTILGIVIGIASVIAMVSVGQGAQGSIQSSIESIGSNLILVTPGAQRGFGGPNAGRGTATTLTVGDAEAIRTQISSAYAVAEEISRRYQVRTKAKNTNTQVVGTVPAYASIRRVQLERGSFLSPQALTASSKVAVIGPTVRNDLFGAGTDPVGQTIRINQTLFRVIGLTREKGGMGFGSQDDVIYIPLTTAQRVLAGGDSVTMISVQAADQESMAPLVQKITSLLLSRHNIAEPSSADFSVMNQSDLVAAASNVTEVFTALLASIAGISLLVGGIGIMNMMLTTVTERTREIGLRMAIGGRRRDISRQFLAEAICLTVIGGVMGLLLGWILSFAIRRLAQIPTDISLSSILLALGVSAGIGLLFGFVPARRASRLNPIDALRYE
jgi:putative ABC transport system permease protein